MATQRVAFFCCYVRILTCSRSTFFQSLRLVKAAEPSANSASVKSSKRKNPTVWSGRICISLANRI
jgi:hypothetical protein